MAFLVLSLPRSRSAWLAHWLSEGLHAPVGHDTLVRCGSVEEFLGQFVEQDGFAPAPLAGSCETAAVVGWRLIRALAPELKLVVVRRPLREVIRSLEQFGLAPDEEELRARDYMLDCVQALPGVLAVQFHHLHNPAICAQLWNFCTGATFDRELWQRYSTLNIQIDMAQRLSELFLNWPKHQSLRAEVAHRTLELDGQCHFQFN